MSNDTAETLSVVVERDMPFPPEKIWRALTEPKLIEVWLMKNDFKPEVGHQFHMSQDWGALDCQVLAVEPNRKLSYTWNFAHDDPMYNLKSVVLWTLTPTATGTHLRMQHQGFRSEQVQACNGAKWGWQKFIGNLEQLVERSAA